MLVHAQDDRPLHSPNDPELLANLRQRYMTRLPIYSQATVVLTGETTGDEILQHIGKLL